MIEAEERRVYGPPGTGKTTWIAHRAEELADEFGADQVSICSLTRAAIREVAGRDLSIPSENITTLHARCKRALMAGKPAEAEAKSFAKAHPSFATDECMPKGLVRGSSDDDTSDEVLLSGGGLTLYEHAQILRQQMVSPREWEPRVAMWYAVWSDWCKAEGLLDFTGWLEACNGTHALPPQQILFVDEAQDHTPLQLAVVRSWDVRRRYLVGDDDQNLYEWSGAVPRRFLEPAIPEEHEMVLSQSYRVPRAVHGVASAWISAVSYRKEKEYTPRDADGELDYSGFSLLDARSGGVPDSWRDPDRRAMVLASCSYMLNDVLHALKAEAIPFHNPYRRADAHWNPLERPLQTMRSLVVGDRDWTGNEALRWASALSEGKAFYRGGKGAFLESCREAGGHPLPGGLVGEFVSDDAEDLAISQDIAIFEKMRMTGATGDWPYSIRVARAHGVGVEPWVIVGTIHSVKGGEADTVALFPDLSPAGYAEYASSAHRDRIIRLFYVGMTRARDRLELCERSSPRAVDWI
jgi:superfamily I DNA/RNA helicase